jgi:hypothetical protein
MVTADSPAMAERSESGVILQRLEELAASDELAKYERYFPIAQRGADVFIGVRMGEAFALAKHHVGMPLGEISACDDAPDHPALRDREASPGSAEALSGPEVSVTRLIQRERSD